MPVDSAAWDCLSALRDENNGVCDIYQDPVLFNGDNCPSVELVRLSASPNLLTENVPVQAPHCCNSDDQDQENEDPDQLQAHNSCVAGSQPGESALNPRNTHDRLYNLDVEQPLSRQGQAFNTSSNKHHKSTLTATTTRTYLRFQPLR